jgi:hypothetical protein
MFNDEQTYQEFKLNFYSRIKDFSLFDVNKDINLTKVVLSGLRVNYIKRGKYRTYLFYTGIIRIIFIWLKRMSVDKRTIKGTSKKVLVLESNRFALRTNEKNKVKHAAKIVADLGRENCLVVVSESFNINDNDADYSFNEIKNIAGYYYENEDDRVLLSQLIKCYKQIEHSQIFGKHELANIKIAFHEFYAQYITTNYFLNKNSNVRHCLLVCHYHNEGKIAALKKRGIAVIELQHGLIAQSDIFYCFPKDIVNYRKKMLFPDRIWVWGDYWKKVLMLGHEFSEEQIVVKGDFITYDESGFENTGWIDQFLGDSPLKVVICTQISLHEYFIQYAKWLSQTMSECRIIVKIHPSESSQLYNELLNYENIRLATNNLQYLFEVSDVHISIYSTTLIESKKYGVTNYSLNVPICKDYIEEYSVQGISIILKMNEIPLKLKKTISEEGAFYKMYEESTIYSL